MTTENKPKVNDEELPAPLLTFPCEFPMKIVGVKKDGLAEEISELIQKYDPKFNRANMEMRLSSNGKFLSLGVLVYATSQDMLDNVYRAVTSHPSIKFVL